MGEIRETRKRSSQSWGQGPFSGAPAEAQPDQDLASDWERLPGKTACVLTPWDFQRDDNDFRPETIRNLQGLEQVGVLSSCKEGGHTQWEAVRRIRCPKAFISRVFRMTWCYLVVFKGQEQPRVLPPHCHLSRMLSKMIYYRIWVCTRWFEGGFKEAGLCSGHFQEADDSVTGILQIPVHQAGG